MFIKLLTSIESTCNHTRCISLSHQKWRTRPTLINLHPNEYSQELRYYSFAVNLDRCVGSYNTLDDLSNRVYVPNETEDWNLSIFNMVTRKIGSNALTKHISCKCECTMIDVGVSVKIWKSIVCTRKNILGILLQVVVKIVII